MLEALNQPILLQIIWDTEALALLDLFRLESELVLHLFEVVSSVVHAGSLVELFSLLEETFRATVS